tara:strand:- start:1255 stop:3420 length:2166 start_codon:yes stop_codon:yes gene_type:complete
MNHLKKENLSSQPFFKKNFNLKNNFLVKNSLTKVCTEKVISKKTSVNFIPFTIFASVLSACNNKESSNNITPINITAVKAPLQGALAFVDRNNDGIFTIGEEMAITDANGSAIINLNNAVNDNSKVVINSIRVGDIIGNTTFSSGTIDTVTGNAIENLILKAPATYTVVTPITTVVAETQLSEDKVKEILGLPSDMDVKNFNPYKENKTAEEETIALTAEKVALQIHTTISTIQASGVSGGLDNDEAFSTALETVVEVVEDKSNINEKVDFANNVIIDQIVSSSSSKLKQKLNKKGDDTLTSSSNLNALEVVLTEAKNQITNINTSTDEIKSFDKNELGNIANLAEKSKKEVAEAVIAEKAIPGSGKAKLTMMTSNENIPEQATSTQVEEVISTTNSSSSDTASSSASSSDTPSSDSSSKLKILVLHGGGETSTSFKVQAGVIDLMNNLSEYEFIFADAPLNNVWMQDPPGGKGQATTDPNWADNSITYLDNLVSENGPFFGILGYSQGAAFIPVYLSKTSNTFKIAMMYNGYLPTTHEGLINQINSKAPFKIPALVFSGEYDYFFKNLAQGLADKFDNSLFIKSSLAGHHLPVENDPTFAQILYFISTNSSSSSNLNTKFFTYNGGNGNDTLFGGTDAEILTGGTGSDSFWFSKNSGNDIIKDYSKAEGDKIVFFRESSDTENFSISDSNKIKWGSLSIELEGVILSSENDVIVEFIEIA